MKYLIVIIHSAILFANGFDNIPFDWSGQFGFTNYRGSILWNQDWRSQRLFFDGTWAVYPRMYGPEVEKGFYGDSYKLNIDNDSLTIDSYFQYNQGDYLLDRFSFAVEYQKNKRNFWFHGFKRTYAGNFNQFSNGISQPQQQSYLFGYESSFGKDDAGISLGHFNTYSGYPDTLQNGLFDNRITTSNIYWKRKFNKISTFLTIDNFLQRYQAIHSLAYISNPRYLTRNKYETKFIYPIIGADTLSLILSFNERFVKMGLSFNEKWYNYLIKYGTKKSNINFGTFILGHKNYFQYSFNFEKVIGLLTTKMMYSLDNRPVHPYFILNEFQKDIQRVIINETISSTLIINLKKNIISATIFQINEKNKLAGIIENDSLKNIVPHRVLDFFYQTTTIPYLNMRFSYKMQDSKAIYSSGIANYFEIRLQSKFKLFNDFMDLSVNSDFKHFRDRMNNFFINPLEMVPVYHSSENHNILDPVNIINASISAQVSNFKISYQWYNLGEMVLKSLQSSKENLFTFHPNIPYLGSQASISITWMFKN
ncbi:MAG: hypothetical protein ACJZ12_01065 [Candidatus Neomarinimicrobiota bacterium]